LGLEAQDASRRESGNGVIVAEISVAISHGGKGEIVQNSVRNNGKLRGIQ
jgi:hypothetical protein